MTLDTPYKYSPQIVSPMASVQLFQDPALTVPAVLTAVNDTSLGNTVPLLPDGSWPTFNASTPALYLTHPTQPPVNVTLTPTGSFVGAPYPVTGSRSTATAATLESLIQALIKAGVPISDQTAA